MTGAPSGGGPEGEAGGRDAPATTGQGWAWMAIAVGGFVGGQIVSAVLLLGIAAATGHLAELAALATKPVPPPWVVIGGLVGLWVGFVGALIVASRSSGTGKVARDMGLRFRWVDALVGPAVGIAGQLVLLPLLYLPLAPFVPNLSKRLSAPAEHLTGGFKGGDLAVIAVLTVLVVPVIEELVFRGLFLRGALRAFGGAGRRLGPVLAVAVTGVVFALAHFEALQLLGLAAFGVVLSYMAYRTGRVGTCIVAHGTFNLVAVVAVATTGGLR